MDNPVETAVDKRVNNVMSCRRKTLHEGASLLACARSRDRKADDALRRKRGGNCRRGCRMPFQLVARKFRTARMLRQGVLSPTEDELEVF